MDYTFGLCDNKNRYNHVMIQPCVVNNFFFGILNPNDYNSCKENEFTLLGRMKAEKFQICRCAGKQSTEM